MSCSVAARVLAAFNTAREELPRGPPGGRSRGRGRRHRRHRRRLRRSRWRDIPSGTAGTGGGSGGRRHGEGGGPDGPAGGGAHPRPGRPGACPAWLSPLRRHLRQQHLAHQLRLRVLTRPAPPSRRRRDLRRHPLRDLLLGRSTALPEQLHLCQRCPATTPARPGRTSATGSASSPTSVTACGPMCTACPMSPNGTTSCDGTQCALKCNDGYYACEPTQSCNLIEQPCRRDNLDTCAPGYRLCGGKCLVEIGLLHRGPGRLPRVPDLLGHARPLHEQERRHRLRQRARLSGRSLRLRAAPAAAAAATTPAGPGSTSAAPASRAAGSATSRTAPPAAGKTPALNGACRQCRSSGECSDNPCVSSSWQCSGGIERCVEMGLSARRSARLLQQRRRLHPGPLPALPEQRLVHLRVRARVPGRRPGSASGRTEASNASWPASAPRGPVVAAAAPATRSDSASAPDRRATSAGDRQSYCPHTKVTAAPPLVGRRETARKLNKEARRLRGQMV